MTEDEINRKFDLVADHLATLAINQERAEARMDRAEARMDRAETRMDRLERVVKLAIRAGLRERRDTRQAISALIDSHIKLAEAQAHTDKRLDALIDIVREGRNGKS